MDLQFAISDLLLSPVYGREAGREGGFQMRDGIRIRMQNCC